MVSIIEPKHYIKIKDVHTEHCCIHHGCKYSDEDCTVVTNKAIQSYPCEYCYEDDSILIPAMSN